ncbi:uncharacterized protein LOC116348366 [Contarinia nasturtii]|uniref:uncharacterized protein LOC116348366 n=1 Tax=Contarinia nasturtii TaxID=265458 RepID=UPI0012D38356|nr:uncharacterized protein LOC116348366 [Contarinia nasturtii]
MKILFSVSLFVLFLNECNGYGCVDDGCVNSGCFGISKEKFNVDNFNYTGDPVTFACIGRLLQKEFYITEVNVSIPSHLIDRLNNTKGISLLFYGIGNKITLKNGLLYKFAKEWFIKSKRNICIISYAFKKGSPLGIVGDLNKMVTTKRLEFVAKLARDLVLGVRAKSPKLNGKPSLRMSQIDVSGFSFGAHVAGRTCQYLKEKTKEQARMLLALDPSRTPPLLAAKPLNTIQKGHAKYVQVIHTSKVAGVWDKLGDIDIYADIKQKSWQKDKSLLDTISDSHGLAFFIHVATATKRLFLIANQNRTPTIIERNLPIPFTEPTLKENEVLIGVYSTLNPKIQGKKFEISFKNKTNDLWEALGQLSSDKIFFEQSKPVLTDDMMELVKNNQNEIDPNTTE